jgi:hypothetical protein
MTPANKSVRSTDQSCKLSANIDDASLRSFEFVAITQPSEATNTAVSKQIRTQVMKDYLRKQTRQAITGDEEVLHSVKPEKAAHYRGKFKLSTWSHKTRTKELLIPPLTNRFGVTDHQVQQFSLMAAELILLIPWRLGLEDFSDGLLFHCMLTLTQGCCDL